MRRARCGRRSVWSPALAACAVGFLAASGCGSAASKGAQQVSTGPAALANAYQALQAQQSVSMSMIETISKSGRTLLRLAGAGAFHWTPAYGEMTMDVAGQNIELDFTGTEAFVHVPAVAASQLGGKSWIGVSMSDLMTGATSYNPTQFLQVLSTRAQSVTRIGRSSINGVETTEYQAVMDLDRYPSAQTAFGRQAVTQLETLTGSNRLPLKVWIDGSGRPRQFSFTETIVHAPAGQPTAQLPIDVSVQIDFPRYGLPVHTFTPPESQVDYMTLQQLLRLQQGAAGGS